VGNSVSGNDLMKRIVLAGIAFPEFPVGESRTVDFYYLFSTDLDHVPPQFATFVPEPSCMALVMLGLVGAAIVRQSRRTISS
jgi:hypothetical protein